MPAINNPAGRLHAILTEAMKSQETTYLRNVWGSIFGIEATDTPKLLAVLIQLMATVAETRARITSIKQIDHETYLKAIVHLEKAVSHTNIEGNWGQFRMHITEATMLGLAFCSDTLARVMPEEVIDPAVLDELKADVEAMIDELLKSDIEPTLRAVVLDHLESIRRAIVEYKIRGTRGLRQALDSGIGSLMRHRDELEASESKGFIERLGGFFSKLDRYVSVGIAAKQLCNHVQSLLPIAN